MQHGTCERAAGRSQRETQGRATAQTDEPGAGDVAGEPLELQVEIAGPAPLQGLAIAALIEQLCSGGTPDTVDPGGERSTSLAVVGAHLLGMPLHHDLLACGAVLQARTRTAAPPSRSRCTGFLVNASATSSPRFRRRRGSDG